MSEAVQVEEFPIFYRAAYLYSELLRTQAQIVRMINQRHMADVRESFVLFHEMMVEFFNTVKHRENFSKSLKEEIGEWQYTDLSTSKKTEYYIYSLSLFDKLSEEVAELDFIKM